MPACSLLSIASNVESESLWNPFHSPIMYVLHGTLFMVVVQHFLSACMGHKCIYNVTNDGSLYTLDLRGVANITLYSEDGTFAYSPCRNGIKCDKGNAEFMANSVLYNSSSIYSNACERYIGVDHDKKPTYSSKDHSFLFRFDGEDWCATSIYWECSDDVTTAWMASAQEVTPSVYHLSFDGKHLPTKLVYNSRGRG